ncbi:CrcB family protein [Bifidobacterium sp. ESL0790]|uniref:fluoride efflux transporter FluC n=1 Tax=Bifidobacterium sp. ESL0790 TaxID=2983233 RepID=UPI0023F7234B|nr:CrcB family protein [Bifidobacterium sp. ESL0790]WEV72809.1 CrcB family protein [Bifidobacterium sp. ESL0790]
MSANMNAKADMADSEQCPNPNPNPESRPKPHRSSEPSFVVAVGLVAGGACGSLIRLALSALQSPDVAWPWMTMAINLTGAVLLGCLTAYMAAIGPDIGEWRVVRLSLGTGMVGGYTTYSTFMLEAAQRVTAGKAGLAMGYLAASIVFGLLCAMLGLALGSRLGRWHAGRIDFHPDRATGGDAAPRRAPNWGPVTQVAALLAVLVMVLAIGVNARFRHGAALGLLLLASLLGGCGAFMRYLIDAWTNNHVHLPFPCGTIVVNVTACLLMGLMAGWCGAHAGLETLRYLLASGLLGGYSTFGTASLEGAKLVNQGKIWQTAVHTLGMALVSFAAIMVGLLALR